MIWLAMLLQAAQPGACTTIECQAEALVKAGDYAGAAGAFEASARARDGETGDAAAVQWAAAGNAWLAAGDAAKARLALDAALARGTLTGLALGEAQLDRARVLVAQGQLAPARVDIDGALKTAADDPLAWLLSATLARRTGDLARARADIAEALKRSDDDAEVQREAGNIAALAGDEQGAKASWSAAVRIAPDSPAGRSSAAALAQFEMPKPPVEKEEAK